MDFSYNISFHSSISIDPYDSLYCRRCSTPIGFFKVGESLVLGPDLIYKTLGRVHIIGNQFQTTYNCQKSYADHKRRDLEFEKRHKLYLIISHMKGVVRFFKKGKLSAHYVVRYSIL